MEFNTVLNRLASFEFHVNVLLCINSLCAVVNSIFRHEAESRRRNMRLRTFAVICINEECGILEWVNNTNCKFCYRICCAFCVLRV